MPAMLYLIVVCKENRIILVTGDRCIDFRKLNRWEYIKTRKKQRRYARNR